MPFIIHLATVNTLPGMALAIAALVAAFLGSCLVIILMVSGVIALAHSHFGKFAIDVAAAIFIGYFIFNYVGAESLLKTTSGLL